MAYTDVFGGSTVQPSDVQFASVALAASITTDWPQFATTTQPMARIMKVAATAPGLTLALPDTTLVSAGQDVLFDNSGAETFTVLDAAGGTVATLTAGQVKYLYLSDNATAAGVWRVTVFGVGSSTLDASQLAGYGIKAISATLNTAAQVSVIVADTTVVAADRSKVFVWGGVSGTLELPTTSGSTADFAVEVRNQGTGTLTISPVGGVLIDSALSITLSVNESCFVHMGATDWYTVGRGRNTNFNFTQLAKAVTGGTTALTLTESSNVVQTYTGVLLSNQIITLPAVVQVYYVRNNTTGAYTFTFACAAGGSTVTVAAAQAAILFCDGTNIINANTSLAGGITALLFGAGSATVPSAAFGTSDNGLYAPALNEVGMTINGSQVGKWTSAGYTGTIVSTVAAAAGITSATTTVTTSAAAAPTAGQVLTASSGTVASWQTPVTSASILYSGRTSNTILGVADKGNLIDITSGTFSQTLDAAATLTSGWWCYVRNSGTGTITIDPSASETINGATTYTLNAGSIALIQCDGSVFRTVMVEPNQLIRTPIFAAATLTGLSVLEQLANSVPVTGLGNLPIHNVVYGNSLFLASTGVSGTNANIASSPDGVVWTLRAMPSTTSWVIGTNGTNKFVACDPGATAIAKSTDGTTWVAGTALAAAAVATYGFPVFVGDRVLVCSTTASTAYWSDDNGGTWTTATLPSTVGGCRFFSVGGLFWYFNSATTAYTSATGATSSWTSRTLPVTPNQFFQQTDGSLWISANTATVWYQSTDGINWTAMTAVGTPFGGSANEGPVVYINGVYAMFSATLGRAGSYHNGLWVMRQSPTEVNATAYASHAQNVAGTIFVFGSSSSLGNVLYVEPAASTAKTAMFTG